MKSNPLFPAYSEGFKPEIFKSYDIRGKYPEELDEKAAFKIGQSFFLLTKARTILVGGDNRLSSESLKRPLVTGLVDQGVRVTDIGLCSTPEFYWAVCYLKAEAGIMITASHLSKEYNGFKAVLGDGMVLANKQILDWQKLFLGGEIPPAKKEGKVIKQYTRDLYTAELKKHLSPKLKQFKIVMDSGNAVSGLYLNSVFGKTPLRVIPLFWEPDGNFPSHGLNPKIKENRESLAETIREEGADMGFMWDGDSDRFYVLDNEGEVIDPSFVSAIIGRYLVSRSGQKKVVVSITTSRVVKDEIKEAKGEVLVTKVWHVEIKKAMRETKGAIFGSETSGHYIFKDFYYIDDGILAAIYFLNALSADERSLEWILKGLREKYFIIEEINFSLPNQEIGGEVLVEIKNHYQEINGEISKLDGLSVEFPDWRFNLRSSKSEPLLRLNLEANSEELMEEKLKEIVELIKKTASEWSV